MEFNNRMQKYRSKLKENPEKLKEHLERERERDRKRRNLKKATMDEKALVEKRKRDRERQRKHRENKIKSINMEKVSVQMPSSNLFESLKTQTGYADLHDAERFQLREILKTLNAMERSLVAKYYCKLPWNIGSLRVLGILQELRILTATEYILSQNTEEVQLILNDFLETEYDLISNIFISYTFESTNYVRLNAILDECLENLFKDLLLKPDLSDLQFLNYIRNNIPADIVLKIIYKVLSSILALNQSNVREAFSHFSSWINEGVDELKFPQDLYKQLLCAFSEETLSYLLKCSTSENFKEWKFYLIMLQTIAHNTEISGPYMRKYLKLRLKQCATMPNKRNIMHLLLTARAATATTLDVAKNLNNYADWYKINIAEMKFFLKAEEFQNILGLLEQSINYEMEIDYLEIHSMIAISPPVLCGKLVQTYKSKCKQRLQQIKKGNLQAYEVNEFKPV